MVKSLKIAIIAGLLLSGLLFPIHHDEAVFLTMGRGWNAGLLPYRDLFDHKPPGIYLVARMLSYVFSGNLLIFGARLITASANLLTAFILVKFIQEFIKTKSETLFVIWLYILMCFVFHGYFFLTTSFASMLLVASWFSCMRWTNNNKKHWLWFSGLLMGLSTFFKQPYVVLILPILLILTLNKKDQTNITKSLEKVGVWLSGVLSIWLIWIFYAHQKSIALDSWIAMISYHNSYLANPLADTIRWLPQVLLPFGFLWLSLFMGLRSICNRLFKRRAHEFSLTYVSYLLALSLVLIIPVILYRPYHHYWMQLAPIMTISCVIGLSYGNKILEITKIYMIILSCGYIAYAIFNFPGLMKQLEVIEKSQCSQENVPLVYLNKNCLPDDKYFY